MAWAVRVRLHSEITRVDAKLEHGNLLPFDCAYTDT